MMIFRFPWISGRGFYFKLLVLNTTVKNLKWRVILFSVHAVHGRRHGGEFCHIR